MGHSEKKAYERKTKNAEQALASLMRYAARAERSSGDAMRLMHTWGVPEADRKRVLDRLIAERFIDDERFAEAYVRDKRRLSGWGVYKIRAGLAGKGISRDIIDRVLADDGDEGGKERLSELLVRKSRTIKGTGGFDRRAKLIRFALSRGYRYDEVMEAVDNIALEEED